MCLLFVVFFVQVEDGIRDLVRSRGLGDVYKRQVLEMPVGEDEFVELDEEGKPRSRTGAPKPSRKAPARKKPCLLYTSDAADERSSVDLGGRRIITKKKQKKNTKKHKKTQQHTTPQ